MSLMLRALVTDKIAREVDAVRDLHDYGDGMIHVTFKTEIGQKVGTLAATAEGWNKLLGLTNRP